MGISDLIAGFIREMIESENGFAELQRSELAQRFNCVPSQINYVISTRFPPEHGYIVESRRGGGGYIRITRVRATGELLLMHAVNSVGGQIDARAAQAFLANLLHAGVLAPSTASIMAAAVSGGALACLPVESRDSARAGILKQMLLAAGSYAEL